MYPQRGSVRRFRLSPPSSLPLPAPDVNPLPSSSEPPWPRTSGACCRSPVDWLNWKGYRVPWTPKTDLSHHHMQHRPDYDMFHGVMEYLHTEVRRHIDMFGRRGCAPADAPSRERVSRFGLGALGSRAPIAKRALRPLPRKLQRGGYGLRALRPCGMLLYCRPGRLRHQRLRRPSLDSPS